MKKYIEQQFEREEALLRNLRASVQHEQYADAIGRVEMRLRQSFRTAHQASVEQEPRQKIGLLKLMMPVMMILLLTITSTVPTYLFMNRRNVASTEEITAQSKQPAVLGSSGATTQSESVYTYAPENTTTKESRKNYATKSTDSATLCGSTPGLLCDQNTTAMALGASSNPFHEILDNLGGWRGMGIISILWFIGYSVVVLVVMGVARIVRGLRSQNTKFDSRKRQR